MTFPGYEVLSVDHTDTTSGIVHVAAPVGKFAIGAGWEPVGSGSVTADYPDTDGQGWNFKTNAFGGSISVTLYVVVADATDQSLADIDSRITTAGNALLGPA